MTGQRIKKLRKEKGLTQEQLGNLLGVKKSAIAKYENNRVENLKKETIQKLSEIFEVPATYFLGIDETNQPTITNSITIPLYNDISCGTGIFVDDNIDEYIAFDGYKALEKCLTQLSRDDVVEMVVASGLRGRGGGGFPTGLKWKFAKARKAT